MLFTVGVDVILAVICDIIIGYTMEGTEVPTNK